MPHSCFKLSPMSRRISLTLLLLNLIFLNTPNDAAFVLTKPSVSIKKDNLLFSISRGGGKASEIEEDPDEDSDESESSYDSESESDEEEEVATLLKSTVASAAKIQKKRKNTVNEDATLLKSTAVSAAKIQKKHKQESKSNVNVVLQTQKLKRKRKSIFPKIPYLLRACLSPFTLFSMTRSYFASLINVSYLDEIQSQSLRPSFEEQAKFDPRPKKGKRIMKRGQAKTISDLPKLG